MFAKSTFSLRPSTDRTSAPSSAKNAPMSPNPPPELDYAFSFKVGPVKIDDLANPADAPFGINRIEMPRSKHVILLPHVELDGACREIGDGSNERLRR
jgi:hypothetical protein